MAEKQLQQMIESMLVVSDIHNMDDVNPIVHRLSNNTIRQVTTVVCGKREPTNMILPLNVVWFVYDQRSNHYMQALQRVSKEAGGQYVHTWKVIDTLEEFYAEQAYDSEDAAALNLPSPVPLATLNTMGIARLSETPANPAAPIGVGEGDQRLTDARKPRHHTHDEIPATMIQSRSGQVIRINTDIAPVVGATLVYQGNNIAVWRQLTTSDVQQ